MRPSSPYASSAQRPVNTMSGDDLSRRPDPVWLLQLQFEKALELLESNGRTLRLSPEDVPLGDRTKIPSLTNYCKLSRSLPSMSSQEKGEYRDEDLATELLNRLYDGEFMYTWAQDDSTFVLQVNVDDSWSSFFQERFENWMLQVVVITSDYTSSDPSAAKSQRLPRIHPSVTTILDSPQAKDLLFRAIHQFYRKHAVELVGVHREKIFQHLQRNYTLKKRFTYLIDLTIAYADAEFVTGSGDSARNVIMVGEALEGKGRFRDAALVYEDVVSGLDSGTLSNERSRVNDALVKNFVGLAYKRAGDYSIAEKWYASSLWSDIHRRCLAPVKWDVNDGQTQSLLGSMATLMQNSIKDHGGEIEPIDFCFAPFLGLLYTAGHDFLTPEHGLLAPEFQERLKTKFVSSKIKAIKSLRALAATDKVEDFRSTLLSYVRPDLRGKPSPGVEVLVEEKSDKTSNKDTARLIFENADGVDCWICSNPKCLLLDSNTKFMVCPCRDAKYCCKDCQVVHWPVHKKKCSARAAKKK